MHAWRSATEHGVKAVQGAIRYRPTRHGQELEMTEKRSCGEAMAEESSLPAKLAVLTECVANNLEAHMRALNLQDENARRENAAYHTLTTAHHEIADHLRATSEDMASYRYLPMSLHDAEALSAPEVSEAFDKFVTAEHDLLVFLQSRVVQDQATLREMRRGGGEGEAAAART
jgi:hypothetical protein